MTFHRAVAAALIGIGFGVVLIPAADAGASPTILTVGSARGCTGTYATISDAVAAASAGDTIQVCAGTYDETVYVNVPDLTFDGAKAGHHATAGRAAALGQGVGRQRCQRRLHSGLGRRQHHHRRVRPRGSRIAHGQP